MAISAKFIADFSSFQNAVKQADVSLGQFDVSTKKISASLNKLTESFSGDKIKRDAALAEEAVLRIGGASKLTESEQARVNHTITEALAKYKQLGQDAPASLRMMADETKKVESAMEAAAKPTDAFTQHFKGVLAGMLSATAIIGGVKSAFSALSAFIGGSIESFAAAEASQRKLTAALTAAGRATPDVLQQFDKLATQFQKTTVFSDDLITEMQALLVQVGNVMPHQMESALTAATNLASGLGVDLRQATMLVGKAFEGETGTLKRYGIVIDEAKLKAEGMPAVLEAIQSKFGGQARAEAESYAGQIKQVENAWDNLKEAVGKKIVTDPVFIATLREIKNAAEGSSTAATENKIAWGLFINLLPQWAKDLKNFHGELKEGADEANRLAKQIADIKPKPIPTVRTESQLPTPLATDDERKRLEGPDPAKVKAAADAVKQYAESVAKLRDSLTGVAVQGEVKKLQDAFNLLTPAQAASAVVTDKFAAAAKRLYDDGAKLTPQLFKIVAATQQLTPPMQELSREMLQSLGPAFKSTYDLSAKLPTVLQGLSGSIGHVFAIRMPEDVQKAIDSQKKLKETFGELSRALADLAQVAGPSFAGIVSGLATIVSAANSAQKGVESFAAGMKSLKTGDLLQGLAGVSTGILGIVTAAIAAGRAIANIFDKNKGRDLAEAFAETFGGFDALHKELLTLGAAGEELWKKLTQGRAENNPEAAQAAIDEIIAALAAQKKKTDEATAATEESAQATVETATQAAKALEELGVKLVTNADDWGHWSDRVTGYLDNLAKAIRSLPVPSTGGTPSAPSATPPAEPGFASGTRGQYLDFGAGTNVRLHGRERIMTAGESSGPPIHITVVSQLDGRKIAEASARYIPEVMEGRF